MSSETKTTNCKTCKNDFIQLKKEKTPRCPSCSNFKTSTCKGCGVKFEQPKSKASNLCNDCSEKKVIETVIKICKSCDEEFERPKNNNRQHCDNCNDPKKRKKKVTETKIINCEICKEDFEQLKTGRSDKCITCRKKITAEKKKVYDKKVKDQLNNNNLEQKITICKTCEQEFSQPIDMNKVKCERCVRNKQKESMKIRNKEKKNEEPVMITDLNSKKTICKRCNEEFTQLKLGKKIYCDKCNKEKDKECQAKWRNENREKKNESERMRRANKLPEKKELNQRIINMKKEGSEISDEYWRVCKTCNVKKTLDEYYFGQYECYKCANQATNENYKERRSKYYENNKEKIAVQQHESYEKNKSQIREKYNQKVRENDDFRIKKSDKDEIINIVNFKTDKFSKYLDCDADFFRKWLRDGFDENMDFENHGDWHVDHVIPLKLFNVTNQEDFDLCFNWRNTNPMNGKENMHKKAVLDKDQIIRHKERLLKFSDTEETRQYLEKWEAFIEKHLK